MAGFEQECLAAGYSGYLSKPIDLDRFMTMMAEQLDGRPVVAADPPAAPNAPEPAPENPSDPPSAATADPIVSSLPADNPRFDRLILKFAARLKKRLDIIAQLDLGHHRRQVAEFAHWLKGSGGTVGFHAFTDPAGKLESLARSDGDETELLGKLAAIRQLVDRMVLPSDGSAPAAADAGDHRPATDQSTASGERLAGLAPDDRPLPDTIQSSLAAMPQFHKIIAKFIPKLNKELSRAQRALENENWEELALIAHWLKGSAGTVGFDDFTTPATKLEHAAQTAHKASAEQLLAQVTQLSRAVTAPEPLPAGQLQPAADAANQAATAL